MLQVTQYQKTGELRVEELPEPLLPARRRAGAQYVLADQRRNRANVGRDGAARRWSARLGHGPISSARSGTMSKREGLLATYRKVQTRLDNVKELGYSSAGVVIESDVDGIAPGDRVACAGTAYHAEVVAVQQASRRPGSPTGRRRGSGVSRALRHRAPGCPPGRCRPRRERRRDRPRARGVDHGAAAQGTRLPRDRARCLDVELRPRTVPRL